MLPGPVWTALLTSTSTRPHSSRTRPVAANSEARSRRSARIGKSATTDCLDLARGGLEAAGDGHASGGRGIVEPVTLLHGPGRNGDVQTGRRQGDGGSLPDSSARSGNERDASGRGHEK